MWVESISNTTKHVDLERTLARSRPTILKRQRERARQVKRREKAARRAERTAAKRERATQDADVDDEVDDEVDPDIAHIVPGPQPLPWDDDEEE
jgi:hypothetical protein